MRKKRILFSLFAAVFVLSLSVFAAGFFRAENAAADTVTVTIHADANGTVEYAVSNDQSPAEDLHYEKIEASKSADVSISDGQYLHLKAAPAEECIFRVWSAKGVPSTGTEAEDVISMKSFDSFSFSELKEQNISNVYAISAKPNNKDTRENSKLKVKYDTTLGDVFLFIGNAKVNKEQIIKHGMWIENDIETSLPFYDRRSSIQMNNVTLLAVPKEEIPSKLDSTKTTKATFRDWSASYYFGNNTKLSEVQPFPYVVNADKISYNPLENKTYDISPLLTPDYQVDETWFIPVLFGQNGLFSCAVEQVYSTSIWWNEQYKTSTTTSGETEMYVDCDTIVANFQEAAPIPNITVTPYEGEQTQHSITLTDYETTIHFPSDCKNSLNVVIEKLQATTENYHVEVFKNYNLTSGERISETINPTDIMQNVVGFNLADITSNCSIVITPDYGEGFSSLPLIIYVQIDTDNGLFDIISEESEETTVFPNGCDWKYDPYFNSENTHAFISGISYPKALEANIISQLHFQVKGSGLFTFEFYLDGLNTNPYGYALYKLDNEITSSAINFSSGTVTDRSVILATGQSDPSDFTGGIEYKQCQIKNSELVKRLDGSDWCSATIHISEKAADQTTDIYIGHAVSELSSTAKLFDVRLGHTVMAVRNVAFYQGESIVSYGIYENEKGDKNDYGTITAKIGETEKNSGTTIPSGEQIDFKVTYQKEDYNFYGWTDGESLLSSETSFTYTVKGNTDGTSKTSIYAVLASKDEPYHYRRGGKFYQDLIKAVPDETIANKDIYIIDDVIISESIEIPAGVNLIVPFENSNRISGSAAIGDATSGEIAWANGNEKRYRLLTIKDGATITIRGGLYLGGVVNNDSHNYQGHTSGAYSEIINNGNIIVEDGGKMDVYGRITGNGNVTVNEGGTLYQPFLILDYSGGSNALTQFSAGQTPFRRYAMINIECQITVNYGGTVYGHATLYALGGYFTLDQPFISYDRGGTLGGDGKGNDTFVMLHKGASVTITYDPTKEVSKATASNGTKGIGKTKMVFEGGATFSYMLFSAMGMSVPTNSVYFSIPYNFDVELNAGIKSGDGINKDTYNMYETRTDFMIMPGAVVTVGAGATLTLNGNVNVLGGLKQGALSTKSYPTAEDLAAVGYSKSGNLIINGTLIMGKKIPVPKFSLDSLFGGSSGQVDPNTPPVPISFLGIIQTSGNTGKIITNEATLEGTIVGGAGSIYFEYKATACVWDSVHEVIANLETGREYTATSDEVFKLSNLQYSNTAGGSLNTLTLNQEMKGSWMMEHTEHVYTKPTEFDESKLNIADGVHFGCSVLGCSGGNVTVLEIPSIDAGTYNGNAVDVKALFEKYLEDKDLSVTFTASGDPGKNAGTYSMTVTLSGAAMFYNGGKFVTEAEISYTIAKATLTLTPTIKHSKQGEELDRSPIEFTLSGIQNGDTSEALRNAIKDKLNVDYINDMRDVDVYSLTVTFTGTLDNYTVVCNKLTYVVTPKTTDVTMTAKKKSWTYGDTLEWKSEEDWLNAFEFTGDYISRRITTVGQDAIDEVLGKALDVDTYTVVAEVTVKYSSEGAEVEFSFPVSAQLHVDQKPVTVKITDLDSEYGEAIKELEWELAEGYSLVGNDTKDALEITLTKEPGINVKADNYAITGTSSSKNYKVTFIEGTYTITQKDISNEIKISAVNEEAGHTVRYTGKNISVSASAKQSVKFVIKIMYNDNEVSALNKIGAYTVTATVKDQNYSGEKEETFTVYHVKGYTQAVVDQLEKVTELCKKIVKYPDKLTADNFDAVKSISDAYKLREDLTETAKANLDKDLEPYMPLLERWNKVADKAENTDYSQVIKTADSVADSPLSGLFVGFTALSVLAALLIGGKRR